MWWIYKIILFVVFFISMTTGLVHYKKMDRACKIIVWYVVISGLTEVLALISSLYLGTNLFISNVYIIVELTMLIAYFNSIISYLKKTNLGVVIAVACILFSILNWAFWQNPFDVLSTDFLAVEAIVVIAMTLIFFYQSLSSDIYTKQLSSHFWINSLLLTYWSFTFFYWLIGLPIYKSLSDNAIWLDTMINVISLITYAGFGIVFLTYRKKESIE